MPELPEVESIAASLRRKIVGLSVDRVKLLWPKLLRGKKADLARLARRTVSADEFAARLRARSNRMLEF